MSVKPLFVSFSGGRSSAVMAKLCVDECKARQRQVCVLFANTGCEHEATLKFVSDCDRAFNLGVTWIEAVTNDAGKGQTAKVVNFDSASRNGEPFEAAIKKYGVFNKSYPNCTGRLKTEPMHWYVRNVIGWKKGNYETAVGIRADECDRISKHATRNAIVYPLVKHGIGKTQVNEIMRRYPFEIGRAHV